MRNNITLPLLSLSFFISIAFPASSSGADNSKIILKDAINSCRNLVVESANSIYADRFIGIYGDAYRGLTKGDYQKLIATVCNEGIAAAEKYKSKDDLDVFLFSMRRYWVDTLGSPVFSVEEISRNYYRALHSIKTKEEALYPELPINPSPEEKITALERYSSQKLLRGMPIKEHCEFMAKDMPDKSIPSDELRKTAILTCEGVMAMSFTKNKHGISGINALKSVSNTYGKDTIEYRYMETTINRAFSESKQ